MSFPMSTPIFLQGVSKSYPSAGGGDPVTVLGSVDLEVGAGESVAVVGPSGCGKSTLLNILGTLDRADGGEVRILGEDVAPLSAKRLARLRGEGIGFIFQMHHLLPQLTAVENVLLPTLALAKKPDASEATDRARQLLDDLGLGDRARHRPAQLSGGERQRVAIARALINEPRIILADEPTGALDSANAEALAGLLGGLVERRDLALVTVTHDPGVAARMGSILTLEDGKLSR